MKSKAQFIRRSAGRSVISILQLLIEGFAAAGLALYGEMPLSREDASKCEQNEAVQHVADDYVKSSRR
jgi:hypothetical protein